MRLEALFTNKRFTRAYPTLRAELVAVRDRVKAIALETWPKRRLELDPDYRELLDLAARFGLLVVHHARADDVFVYVLHAEQSWRILAHQALLDVYVAANGRWSDAAEAYQSRVLGYSDEQIRERLATLRHERLGWGQQTVFLVLEKAQRDVVARVHGRYLDPSLFEGGLAPFFATGERVVRKNAHRLVGKRTLARIAVDWAWFRQAFGTEHGAKRVVQIELDRSHADACNAALEARVQELTADGWRAISRAPSSA